MLSTRFLDPPRAPRALRSRRRWRCSPPAPPARRRRADDGVAVDAEPAGAGGAAGAARLGRSGPRADRAAASRTRRGSRRPTCATPRSTSWSTPTPAPPTAAPAAASQAVAEGAKIIVGPLFSTATAGAQPVGGRGRAERAELQQQPLGGRAERLHPRHHLREHRRPAGRLRPVARPRATSAWSIPPGSRARRRATRWPRAVSGARRARSSASQPYNLSVEGIQAAAGPAAAALSGAGANAVILTDGPTGGLAFISEALRGNGAHAGAGAVPGHAALGRLGRGARRCRACRAASSPRPTRRWSPPSTAATRPPTARPARARRARLRRHRRGRRADRRGARPGRQPVLDRAPDPARGLRRGRTAPFRFTAERPRSSATSRSSRSADGQAVVTERAARSFDAVGF